MGLRAQEPRAPGADRRRFALVFLATMLGLLSVTSTAQASFHLVSIREVYPGSVAKPESSYVELQMYNSGQNHVDNVGLTLYNASGGTIGTFGFPMDLPGQGVNQQTMLVGDDDVATAFGVTPDLVSSSFNVPAAGGAACWAGSIDCVSWGNFKGSLPSSAGAPADGAGGIPDGMAIRRSISGGSCSNLLDGADDSGDSASDFSNASPAPVSYASVPTPPGCAATPPRPSAIVDTGPSKPTKSTSATFTFHSSPVGAEFKCRIDSDEFAACDSGTVAYPGPLSAGSHTFQVKATNANGTGSPAGYTWTIDLTPPTATIDPPTPANPSAGSNVTFKFHASESGSKFECSLVLVGELDNFSSCTTPKTYPSVADGERIFKVLAIDQAGNAGAPASHTWVVNNTLKDEEPPVTKILSTPPDPSVSPTAAFTYESNEAGSTFECALDGAGFTSCQAAGIAYTDLGNGLHNFQVRATDSSGNTDESAAGYSWTIFVLPQLRLDPISLVPAALPETTITAKPGAATRDRTPTFRFKSSLAGSTFQCKLDKGPFRSCVSPLTTKSLSFGSHFLQVQATAGGQADPTPAKSSFKVVKPRRKPRR